MCLFSFNLFSALWPLRERQNGTDQSHAKRPTKRPTQEATRRHSSLASEATNQAAKGNSIFARWLASTPANYVDQNSAQRGARNTSKSTGSPSARAKEANQQLVPLVGAQEERRQYYASNLVNNSKLSQDLIGKQKLASGEAPVEALEATEAAEAAEAAEGRVQKFEWGPGEFGANSFVLLGLGLDDERAGAAMRASMESSQSEVSQSQRQAAEFRIRTSARRHVDFDGAFELDDERAPERSPWSGPFHFIQAADCQFGMIDSYVHHRTEPGWSEEIELCQRLVDVCNRQQPAPLFMIICGDLVDSLPKSEIGRKQVVDFKRIFSQLNPTIPLVCVCGNHDVGDEPTPQTIADYRQTFGDDYFYFTKHDILFIVINSQFYQNREHVPQEASEQDVWLERVLAKCRLFKYSIIFEHIPWFLEQAHEENDYFNIRKEVRLTWLRKFKAAGVTKIMCGHYHRNAGGWFEGMELVVTSAIGAQCGSDKSGVRIVKVFEDAIEHQYYAMADIPLNVELKRTPREANNNSISGSSSSSLNTGAPNGMDQQATNEGACGKLNADSS